MEVPTLKQSKEELRNHRVLWRRIWMEGLFVFTGKVFCASVKWWWHTPLIPALGRQRQVDLCEFGASLVYRASSWKSTKATQRNPVSKN